MLVSTNCKEKAVGQPCNKDEEIIRQLAALNPLEYDRIRKERAKELNIRPVTLDKQIKEAQSNSNKENSQFDDIEPWHEPIFDTGINIVKEEYDTSHYLLENIRARIEQKEYPIFVTAGNGSDKLKQIMHNRYLSNCYEKFSNTIGSLVTFGFNFGEYDEHIIEAVNIAAKHGKKVNERLWSIYIGVYSDEGQKHIESIAHKFACKVHIYDAKTVNVWR